MISIYKIKPAFQKLLQPLLKGLAKMGVTANQITVFAILFSLGLGYLFLYYPNHHYILIILAFGLLFRMVLNALDGMMASQFNMQSKLGEVLNELGDVISDSAIIFPFLIVPGANPIVIISFGVLAIMNEYAGVLGKVIGTKRRYEGPMGKSDRALLIGLFSLIYYFWIPMQNYVNWIFGIGCILIIISTVVRIKNALNENS